MKIDLDRKDITKILKEKYGEDTIFRCFYVESDSCWEARHNIKLGKTMAAPKKEEYVLYFD